jgi:GNAT superfamily N-acetyltransferase
MRPNPMRLSTPQDLPALKALVESAYRGPSAKAGWTHEADLLDDERISIEDLAAALDNPANRVIVTPDLIGPDLIGPDLIGTVTVTHKGDGTAYLGMLCVSPAAQSSGLGRALIAHAETTARDAFAAKIMEMTVISARPELIAYYERRGYAQSGETRPFPSPAGAHLSMVVLTKPL